MECIIRTIEKKEDYRIGEPKEIIVDSKEWQKDGKHGITYSYHMSKERFNRPIDLAYEVIIEDKEKKKTIKIATIRYYDFIDFNYMDCIGERGIDRAAKELDTTSEAVTELIQEKLSELQKSVREEFSYSEEYKAKQEHQEIIQKYNEAKRTFTMQYGFNAWDYDRCYNVFGQLMDAEYLGELNKKLEEREASRNQSKKYRKEYYRSRFNDYFNSSRVSAEYSEEERNTLARFYKVLAKKFHPDANPDVDTSQEMTLLNKLKKEWRV